MCFGDPDDDDVVIIVVLFYSVLWRRQMMAAGGGDGTYRGLWQQMATAEGPVWLGLRRGRKRWV
jgi:hypothetical protein